MIIPNAGKDAEKPDHTYIAGRNVIWYSDSRKQFTHFFQNMCLSNDPAFLGIYPSKMKTYIYIKMCTSWNSFVCKSQNYIQALLECPSIVKLWYLQILEHYACVLSPFSRVQLFATPWFVALQASLSMGSRQEYWNGLPCTPPEDLANPGIEPSSPAAPEMQVDS